MKGFPKSGLEICAIVVTMRPDDGLLARLDRVSIQVGMVVIVDNGDDLENEKKLQEIIVNRSNVIVKHNLKNVGLAAALNIGVSLARQNGYQWLLTLDDDTLIHPTMVERFLVNLNRIDDGKPIGIAAMSWNEMGAVPPPSHDVPAPFWAEKRVIIASGSFFSMDTFDVLGPFREEYFISGIDLEYCLRARAKGFRVIKFTEIGFMQRLGNLKVLHFGPWTIKTYNYGASRYYFAFRNYLMNLRTYAWRDPLYAVAICIFFCRTFLVVSLFESNKKKKIRFMLLGLWHGIIRRMGKTIVLE